MSVSLLMSMMLASGASTQNVDIGQPSPATLVYASEIIASPAAPATLANAGGLLDLVTPLRYNFSAGEVRYARIDCSGGLRFAPGSAVSLLGAGSASLGAINGVGSSVISFSITANDAAVVETDRLVVSGDRLAVGSAPVRCSYGLYDVPSQANAGGTAGRVASAEGDYLRFAPATLFSAQGRTSVADVTATPPYTEFVHSAPTTATTAALGPVQYALSLPAPLTPAGTQITLADLHGAGPSGTRLVVDGDFGAAANADGGFTGAALSRVYLSTTGNSCSFGTPASSLSATQAAFNVGATATGGILCLAPAAGATIPAAQYTARLQAVSAAPAVYRVQGFGPDPVGTIVRNGLELQAPLVQLPDNYLSRLVLTNAGPQGRIFTVRVLGETGNVVSTGELRGTVPGSGTLVIELGAILTGFTVSPRATLSVTMAAPGTMVQGLYQIVNPDAGSVSNHVMVRPGSN
ncbi:MAG: hypothetical protein K0M70_02800 [Arenimonas sp.]|uniref:hypothetical protein n=1 Tax=Arenimonas sp. TaxID=1872635 RepID=UPI0025BB950F|nr:hypothetical protein [Arenimonas sp.]MBW8366770.1 hypothetical protein [Arenimonas sp.]